MSFKIKINGRTYRIQFRLAVLCQVFEQPKDGWLLGGPMYQTEGIQNPEDKFSLYIGAKTAFTKMLAFFIADEGDRKEAWAKFVPMFKPWVKI
jgi:hypothetical protein